MFCGGGGRVLSLLDALDVKIQSFFVCLPHPKCNLLLIYLIEGQRS